MCGIAGWLRSDRQIPSTEVINNLRDGMKHRGPDSFGTWVDSEKSVGLLHRRLSIVDLTEAGNQPMEDVSGNFVIVYNGEVYNQKSLRKQLEKKGHRFRSECDTEVVLEAYKEWGREVVSHLRGMFSFAIWDATEDRLFAARDRLGIKPFYYYKNNDDFVFGSELNAFEALDELDLSIDHTAFYDYFTYLYVPYPKTIYNEVKKLPPAHTLTFENGTVKKSSYWEIQPEANRSIQPEEARGRVRELLTKSVRLRKMSDVPVGSFLSGGVDSSIVTALAASTQGEPISTFTVRFEGASDNEHDFAKLIADRYETNHTETSVSMDESLDRFRSIMLGFGEPFADTSALPTWEISRIASQDVKVVLSGDGGDEVFGGYNWYRRYQTNQKIHRIIGNFFPRLWVSFKEKYPRNLRGYARLDEIARSGLERYVSSLSGFTRQDKQDFLPERINNLVPSDYDDYWFFRQHWEEDLDPWTRMQYLDLKSYLPCDILTKVDRTSMAHSLEVRVPMLDHKLVEYVFSLPREVVVPNGEKKGLLKSAFRDQLPETILDRSKQGFSIPWSKWFSEGEFAPEDLPLKLERGWLIGSWNAKKFNLDCWTDANDAVGA